MLLEVCVETVEGIAAAVEGGADRIELCSALDLGGLTPGAGLMRAASGCGVPVMALVRARVGGFVLSDGDLEAAHDDIAAAREAGLDGVVIGALRPDGRLDEPALTELVIEAGQMDVTLHRCFDLVPDVGEALAVMRRVGIGRVLTSGGAVAVPDGLARLAETVALAGDIVVMPGGGVSPDVLPALRAMGMGEVHASCRGAEVSGAAEDLLGFGQLRPVDVARVQEMKAGCLAG